MSNTVAVAIDGPSGAGKSSLSRLAAQQLHYIYVDTGALYRSVGLFALEKGVNTGDSDSLETLIPQLKQAEIELKYEDNVQKVYLNGRDVSEDIRRPELSMAASAVAALPEVRTFLLELQRDMARRHNVIMDGRDIGTVVLPDAQVKIFLTASAEARARRRWKEYVAKGEDVSYNDVLEDMKQRDYNDSHRATAPLRQAEDAVRLDTSELSFEQSLQLIVDTIKERG